ncbi:hypothetical protein JKP88DRAFT_255736 [Tribonema minus]|uniref:Uncharacterized protein n=1 Tax=Tribonema minus TaxID=303371 RepID=A0A835Z7E8_9STRA|nr:hypothetical protein JKP88DRAFT_255736 [Tribonema minus]
MAVACWASVKFAKPDPNPIPNPSPSPSPRGSDTSAMCTDVHVCRVHCRRACDARFLRKIRSVDVQFSMCRAQVYYCGDRVRARTGARGVNTLRHSATTSFSSLHMQLPRVMLLSGFTRDFMCAVAPLQDRLRVPHNALLPPASRIAANLLSAERGVAAKRAAAAAAAADDGRTAAAAVCAQSHAVIEDCALLCPTPRSSSRRGWCATAATAKYTQNHSGGSKGDLAVANEMSRVRVRPRSFDIPAHATE